MQTKTIPLTQLEPNTGQIPGLPKNPRIQKDQKFKDLVRSLEEDPEMMELRELIVFPLGPKKYVVIAGNFRYQVLSHLKWKEAPCKILDPDTPAHKLQAFAIKDNVNFGEHDWEALANEWDTTSLENWSLEIPDFKTTAQSDDVEEDDYEGPDVDQVVTDIVLGDVFEIGPHRLMCGDSTQKDQLTILMNGQKADMIFTDPPYGVDYDGTHISSGTIFNKGQRQSEKIKNDDRDIYTEVMPLYHHFSKPNHVACYVCFAGSKGLATYSAALNSGWEIRSLLVWNKNHAQFGNMGQQYKQKHEPILYLFKKGKSVKWRGPNNEVTVWDIDRKSRNEFHLTEKPVKLPARAIGNNSDPGDLVIDFFLGGGSTMVASHELGRICFGMELEPRNCQVIVNRMMNLDPTLHVKRNGLPYEPLTGT